MQLQVGFCNFYDCSRAQCIKLLKLPLLAQKNVLTVWCLTLHKESDHWRAEMESISIVYRYCEWGTVFDGFPCVKLFFLSSYLIMDLAELPGLDREDSDLTDLATGLGDHDESDSRQTSAVSGNVCRRARGLLKTPLVLPIPGHLWRTTSTCEQVWQEAAVSVPPLQCEENICQCPCLFNTWFEDPYQP
jgi:hypothetical protein